MRPGNVYFLCMKPDELNNFIFWWKVENHKLWCLTTKMYVNLNKLVLYIWIWEMSFDYTIFPVLFTVISKHDDKRIPITEQEKLFSKQKIRYYRAKSLTNEYERKKRKKLYLHHVYFHFRSYYSLTRTELSHVFDFIYITLFATFIRSMQVVK